MDDAELLTRRALLGRAAMLTGGLLSAPLLAMARGAAHAARAEITATPVWSDAQRELVAAIADTILPETDTPGATTAQVDEFVAHMLRDWFVAAERDRFLAGLDEFAARCIDATGRPFVLLPAAERLAYLQPIDQEAAAARAAKRDPLPMFATLKELTLVGYYTSEAGAAAIGYLGPIGARTGAQGPICTRIWN